MKNFAATFRQLVNFRYIKNNHILLIIWFLLLTGVYFVFNSTVVLSLEYYNNPYRFGVLHLAWVMIGLVFFTYFFNYSLYKIRKLTFLVYYISFISLAILAIAKFLPCNPDGFAPCIKGAIRWLVLNPSPLPEIPFIGTISFQPSELAKLALVLLTSFFLTKETLSIDEKIKKILLHSLFLIGFVFIQPNKSTAIIMVSIVIAIYLIYGEKLKILYYLLPIVGAIFIFFIFYNSYSLNRVKTFLDVNNSVDQNYHQNQIQISLGSGGLLGIGLGKSRQKFSFLPEIFSDSIFAVIGEEAGFIGTLIVTSAVFYLIYLGYKISSLQNETYFKLLGVGITTWFGVQSLINLFAMTQIMPLTGVPLPLISYGGSSTIFMMTALGILGNISRSIYERKIK